MLAACCCAALLAAPAAAAHDGPGAPGAGDPYFPGYGNGGYDVSHYDIQLRYNPDNDHLRGTTTILANPTRNLTAFNLDFALDVESVLVNGVPAKFDRQGRELTVTPVDTVPEGSAATVVVRYQGIPSEVAIDGKSPWIRTSDGALAVGQPEIAPWWFPSNDHPRDKATFDFAITAPNGTEVLANGVHTEKSRLAGWTTWKWRMTSQAATYLAFMGVGDYEINRKTGAFGQPFLSAYSTQLGELAGPAKASVERTPEVVSFLSSMVGEYPFQAQGGVVPSEGLNFALENQTRPTYSPKFFEEGANTSVVVHEIAHQWFGDSVSVDTWRDIWINEGFASYAEWLWSEAQGTGSARELFQHYYSSIPPEDPFWQVTPGNPGADNVFHDAVYDRGAMTLHALRNVIGDRALIDVVRAWATEHRDSTATVEDFIVLAEQRSGKQLDALFDAWLFTPGKPPVGAATGVPEGAAHRPTAMPKAVAEIDRTHDLLRR